MLDTRLRPLIDPPLNWTARRLRGLPLTADAVSLGGLALGLIAFLAIVVGWFGLALLAIVLNRLADGLDGAIARQHGPTRRGGYVDIVFDFFFYAAVPLAFALHDPGRNALAAAVLLASFYANGATFLAFSAVAAELKLTTEAQGRKSIYYLAGLAEGFETIVVFCLMVLVPAAFVWLAFAFAALCFVSAGARVFAVWRQLDPAGAPAPDAPGEPAPPAPPEADAVSDPTAPSAD